MVSVSQLQVALLAQIGGNSRCPPVPTGVYGPCKHFELHYEIIHYHDRFGGNRQKLQLWREFSTNRNVVFLLFLFLFLRQCNRADEDDNISGEIGHWAD